MSNLRKIHDLLTRRERRRALLLVPLVVTMALAEVAGIASLTPFLALLADPGAITTNPLLARANAVFDFQSERMFLMAVGVAVMVVLLMANALMAGGLVVLTRFGSMRIHTISRRLLARLLRRPYPFFLEHNSAALANDVVKEVEQIVNSVILPGLNVMARAAAALGIIVFLVVIDPVLALLMGVLLGGAYLGLATATRSYLARIGRERVAVNRARYQATLEALGAIKELKLMGREAESIRRFDGPSYAYAQYQAGSRLLAMLPRYALETIAFGSIVGVVLLLMRDDRSIDQVVPILGVYAFAGYRLLPALQQLFHSFTLFRYGLGALDAVHTYFEDIPDVGGGASDAFDGVEAAQGPPYQGRVRFEGVTFAFDAAQPVLHGIDLEIEPGESIGIVGGTGAGKSTLVDLLLGLLEPTHGRITVDGAPLVGTVRTRWQRQLGYVPQSIYVTDDTITRNIALGLPDEMIDMASVRRAARMAQIDTFIEDELPNGFDTVVGENGVRLSGGQRQRIGVARALYADPAVLVFDEATSALDGATERALFDAIHALAGTKTVVTIAHRLATVEACDRVLVLDRGLVVESGSYADVLRRSPQLRAMAGIEFPVEALGAQRGVRG